MAKKLLFRQLTNAALNSEALSEFAFPPGANPSHWYGIFVPYNELEQAIYEANVSEIDYICVRLLGCKTVLGHEIYSTTEKEFYSVGLEHSGALCRVIAVLRFTYLGSKVDVALESKEVISSTREILLWFFAKYCSWPNNSEHAQFSYAVWGAVIVAVAGATGDIGAGFAAGAFLLAIIGIATIVRYQKQRETDKWLRIITQTLREAYYRVNARILSLPYERQKLTTSPDTDASNPLATVGEQESEKTESPPPAPDNHIRGRRLVAFEEAREIAAKELEPWDYGLLWGGLRVSSAVAKMNFCVVGAPGSGKTMLLRLLMQSVLPLIGAPEKTRPTPRIVQNLELSSAEAEEMNDAKPPKHRALIYDAKQDIFSTLYGMKDVNCPIYTLHPFDNRCAAWDMAQDITAPATAQQVASILIPKNENASQPFFIEAAQHLLTNVFIALMKRTGKNWEFRDVVLAMKSRKNLVALLQDVPETQDLIEQYFPTDDSGRNTTPSNIMSSIATKMAPFEFVAAAWSRVDKDKKVSLRHWLENEYILVLGNDEAHRTALDAINRVLLKRMIELILAGEEVEGETTRDRTWVFLDEAREAGKLDGLGRLMTKGRSKGATVVLGFQDVNGMRVEYGEKEADEILGLCANKAILRVDSAPTAQWASETFSDFEELEDKHGWTKGGGQTSGENSATGTGTNQGTNSGQGQSTFGSVSANNNSHSQNTSKGTNTTDSSSWGKSINRERVQRAALLPSEFLSLPATNRRNGLRGFFVSPDIGAYKAWISGDLLAQQLDNPNKDVKNVEHRDESHQYLTPWTEADYKRLGLKWPDAVSQSNRNSNNPTSTAPEARSEAKLPDDVAQRRKRPAKISEIDPTDFRASMDVE